MLFVLMFCLFGAVVARCCNNMTNNKGNMLYIKALSFNSFGVNTYFVYDEDGVCAIVDPGVSSAAEMRQLEHFVEANGLRPTMVINTHAHIDHIIGNRRVTQRYDIDVAAHPDSQPYYSIMPQQAYMFGFECDGDVVHPKVSLEDGQVIDIGKGRLEVILTPGHAEGSVCLLCEDSGFVITGDVLFQQSIGRTDLPGGSIVKLKASILERLMTLSDELVVYPGHGEDTTIGDERRYNPFIASWQ